MSTHVSPADGPWTWRAQGEPNEYVMFRPDGGWLAHVRLNGELMAAKQEATMRAIAAAPQLVAALQTFVDEYVALVNSGDCGHWDPEQEPKVIAARAALARAGSAT